MAYPTAAEIEKDLQEFLKDFTKEDFIYEFLRAYGLPKNTITSLKKGINQLAKEQGQSIVKNKICFQEVLNQDLHAKLDQLNGATEVTKNKVRFIMVTDYTTLLAVDRKTGENRDIPFEDLADHVSFFLPLAGKEKTTIYGESPADRKAAEKMAKLFDQVERDNSTFREENSHDLNVFFARILFCYFAEDTSIFTADIFTKTMGDYTVEDGSDLSRFFAQVFKVMNLKENAPERESLPGFTQSFPYVNGGLFEHEIKLPTFTKKTRDILMECGELDWSEINPDIFGSMFQGVLDPNERTGLGAHYTSVPNIKKTIDPLFLTELKKTTDGIVERLNSLKDRDAIKKARKDAYDLIDRLGKIKFFDPACGSGNFLVITYKEIRRIEMDVLEALSGGEQMNLNLMSKINITQFYGIEIEDFAHELAVLSLWLAEHQMNMEFKDKLGITVPALPLGTGANIMLGNATRLNWQEICPNNGSDEIYVFGNPPYFGSKIQNNRQKADMANIFSKVNKKYKNLDYIACWFYLGAQYIQHSKAKLSFVSTNSITQGEQVALLWPYILNDDMGVEIFFAHTSFKWTNNAKGNAGVTCVIIGMAVQSDNIKLLFTGDIAIEAKQINAYLADAINIYVKRQNTSLSAQLPSMELGNMTNDGGNLILSQQEKQEMIEQYPQSMEFIYSFLGSLEFIRGEKRYCLWIEDDEYAIANTTPSIRSRIEAVRKHRLESKKIATQKLAEKPYRFFHRNHQKDVIKIIIPSVSSERRRYIPVGFLDDQTIVSNLAFAIYDPEEWIFAVISSHMHMLWVRAVGGRLKTDYRYSNTLCYNTFPFPKINEEQKQNLTLHANNILDIRDQYPHKTMADLYDPDKMPADLLQAHQDSDRAVELCFRLSPFKNDTERLSYLFERYKKMTEKP